MEWARFLNNHFLETCELSQQIAMEIEKEITALPAIRPDIRWKWSRFSGSGMHWQAT